jgi:ribonuclease D
MEEGMGYSKLCKAMLNIDIDKSLQKANWLERPLSQDLLEYAIRDTEFLIPLHRMLSETLNKQKVMG